MKISEYKVYWLTDFLLINGAPERIIIFLLNRYALVIKALRNKYKEKLIILHLIGIIVIKGKEKRVVTYTPADILVGN